MKALPSERVALLAAIAPVSQAPGSVSTPWISTGTYFTLMAVIAVGVLGAAATVNAKIEQAKTDAGAGAKDIDGAASPQLVKATDDGKQALIDVRSENLDVEGGYGYIRLTLTVGAAASLVSAVLLGLDAREEPVTQAATVKS